MPFCLAEQQRSKEPFVQRKVGVIEDRASRNRELIIAILAVEQLLVGIQPHNGHLATRAFRASGPAEPDKQLAALIIGSEHGVYIN
jgi:hypothetical protein